MPTPPPAEITITTDEIVSVPSGAATLVLPANSMASFRKVFPVGRKAVWLGRDNTVTPVNGDLVLLGSPFEERQTSTFSAMYTGDLYVAHNINGQSLDVKVIEGNS